MIENLNIKNFTVFENANINFSPKINIIIGENGSGKSHLLKLIYSLYSNNKSVEYSKDTKLDELEKLITNNLLKLFLPLDNKLWKLRKTNSVGQAEIEAGFADGSRLKFGFNTNSKQIAAMNINEETHLNTLPVFIPPKEVLSFMQGFTSLYEKYNLTFDKTYYDLGLQLNLPEIRTENIQTKAAWAIEEIEKICGGKFIFNTGGNVVFQTVDTEYSINAIAEGFRKIGMLSQLLKTGAIEPGVSGPLLWDEPEANMNPKLLKFIVQVLIELSRNGQQIIISTHDYVLLKWFDALIKKDKDDHIRYHVLHRNENRNIEIISTENYSNIRPNAIVDTFDDLTDYEISKSMGDLGK